MGKFDDKLIVTDIDGTFLPGKTGVPERNKEAVRAFCAEGGLFTFATGRMHLNLIRAIPDADKLANTPGIMENGTYLYDFTSESITDEKFMEPDILLKAMLYSYNNFPDVGIRLTTKDGFLTNALVGIIKKDLEKSNLRGCINVKPIEEWDCKNTYKVVLRAPAPRVDALREKFIANFGDAFEYSKSAPEFFELQNHGVTKATMLADIRKKYYNKTGRKLFVYACGDYENDIDMLKEADVAVCPSNALPSVKAICDMCLCSCEDGLIGALYDILNK